MPMIYNWHYRIADSMPQMNRLKKNPQLTLKQPIIYLYYIEYNNQTRSRGLTLTITNETKIFIQTCSENKRRVNLQRTSQKHFIKSIYNLPPSVTQISSCSSSLLRHVNKTAAKLILILFYLHHVNANKTESREMNVS